jgi:L-amino acid N-acyltransferase YncA
MTRADLSSTTPVWRSIVLRDGSSVHIRPTVGADEQALRGFLMELCPNSRRLRFFTGAADISDAAHWAALTNSDRFGLLALDEQGNIVGHATYVRVDDWRAEMAVEVADRMHGRGLGTILVAAIAAAAEQRGIEKLVAEVLPENHAMLDVFRDGFDAEMTLLGGTDAVQFDTNRWRLARKRFGLGPQPKKTAAVS